jgi:hypothetical protein
MGETAVTHPGREYEQNLRVAIATTRFFDGFSNMTGFPYWMPEDELLSDFVIRTAPAIVSAYDYAEVYAPKNNFDWPLESFTRAVLDSFTDERDVLLFRASPSWRQRIVLALWDQYDSGELQ